MMTKILSSIEHNRLYLQWWRANKYLPEHGEVVRGIFRDGRELLCECSPEDGVWFIGMIVTDPPIWWSYPY